MDGNSWKLKEIYGNLKNFKELNGNSWKFKEVYGKLKKFMEIY